MARRGRPKIILTGEQLDTMDKLASIHCTNEEIADVIGVSSDTLARNYAERLQKMRSTGKMSLRRHMWLKAQEGNVVMQIWLSKNLLGFKDRHELSSADPTQTPTGFAIEGLEPAIPGEKVLALPEPKTIEVKK